MGRWEPNARGRLGKAAFELYRDRGFDQVTVAEIAARAGLTERTFFRHFPDKREAVFAGVEMQGEAAARAVAEAPESATAVQLMSLAIEAVADLIADHRQGVQDRQSVISAYPELRERRLVKVAELAERLATALRMRGVPDLQATLLGQLGGAVFTVSMQRWLEDAGQDAHAPDLRALVRESLDAVGTAFAESVESAIVP